MGGKTDENSRTKLYEWIESDLLTYSEALFTRMEYEEMCVPLKGELEAVSGWGELVCAYLKKSPEMLRIAQGLLLAGPDGCGKHTAARYAAKYLTDPDGWTAQLEDDGTASPFVYVNVRASELEYLCDGNTSPEDYIQSLFEYFLAEKKQNLCLVVEYPEDCSVERRLTECLADCMTRYRVDEKTAAPFLIVLSRDPSGMSPVLRRQLWMCRVQMPDETMRERFWECALEKGGSESKELKAWLRRYPEGPITAEVLTELTEGMTYLGMRELYDCLLCAVQAEDRTAAETLLRAEIRRVRPEINEAEYTEKQPSEKEILFEKLGSLLDWIPEFSVQIIDAVKETAERHSEILMNLPERSETTADKEGVAVTANEIQDSAKNGRPELDDELKGVLKTSVTDLTGEKFGAESLYGAIDREKIIEQNANKTLGELGLFF